MFEDFNKKIENARIIPVVKVDVVEDALSIARALIDGGINAMEITFRTTEGEAGYKKISDCIKAVCDKMPQMLVGAGTVINADLAEKAVNAGALFIVSPGFNPETVDYCISRNVPVYPGVNSPSQIEMALSKNLNVLKFFPAEECGGLKMLKALSGPFPTVKFMATGGINAKNAGKYLASSNIAAVGGSWMVKADLIKAKNWTEITRLSKLAMASINGKSSCSAEKSVEEKRKDAHKLCKDYNSLYEDDPARKEILAKLIAESGENLCLQGPVQFDCGFNTVFGNNCRASFNFVVLDTCPVKIGNNCSFGANCTITTEVTPDCSKPVTIKDNCRIASGVIICGGVTIGEGSVIGAGRVVTEDVPAGSIL